MNPLPKRHEAVAINSTHSGWPPDGLFIDKVVAHVLLRWPRDIAKFPYGTAWIELRRGEITVGQGPMVVRLNREGTHHVGSVRLADLGVMPSEADGLQPEAWAVWKEDLADIPRPAIERMLSLPRSHADENRKVGIPDQM
jgi:hypothetical protein